MSIAKEQRVASRNATSDKPTAAIQREKNIKHWSRAWKLKLVESGNPHWRDLYNDITR
jgi:putative endonuclease